MLRKWQNVLHSRHALNPDCPKTLKLRSKLLSRSSVLHPVHDPAGGRCHVASPLPHLARAGYGAEVGEVDAATAGLLTVSGHRESGRSSLALLEIQDSALAREAQEPSCTAPPRAPDDPPPPDTIFVDYAAPNLGKELHIGHGRSAIVGDALANLLEYSAGPGTTVHRCSHTGDFGAPLGKLLALGRTQPTRDLTDATAYADAAALAAADPAVAELARRLVVSVVQAPPGTAPPADAARLATILDASRSTIHALLFRRLGLSPSLLEVSESWYVRQGHVERALSDLEAVGATVTEEDGVLLTAGEPGTQRLVLRNSAGAFLYGATDAGALRHRLAPGHGVVDAVYVTDRGQASHFGLLFDLAQSAGWASPSAHSLRHVGLGLVLGTDGKKLGSRKGGPASLSLSAVLDEAVAAATAARRALSEVHSAENLPESQLRGRGREREREREREAATETDEMVGLAALKYYDLRHDAGADYAFDPVQATSLRGDTVVYLLYARARALSLLERGGRVEREEGVPSAHELTQSLAAEAELARSLARSLLHPPSSSSSHSSSQSLSLRPIQRDLLLHCLLLDDVITETTVSLRPQLLTSHLFSLSSKLHTLFVESGRILGATDEEVSLAIVARAALELGKGLSLLGIPPLRKL